MSERTKLPEWAMSWAGRAKCKVHGTRLVWVEPGWGSPPIRVCLETKYDVLLCGEQAGESK